MLRGLARPETHEHLVASQVHERAPARDTRAREGRAPDGGLFLNHRDLAGGVHVFFFKQKTAYEIGLGIPAEPLFRSVNFCVMEAIKLCRLDTPIIFIEARINLSRFVVTGCAAKTSATVTFPSLNLISLFAFCFNIWLNGVAS